MAKFCKLYFYPEAHPSINCGAIGVAGKCNSCIATCLHQLNLTPEQYAVLDNFRIIKQQNTEILYQLTGKRTK